MICGTHVGVPVGVHPIRMGGSSSTLPFCIVVFIKTVLALYHCVPFLFSDLASQTLAIASEVSMVILVVVIRWLGHVVVAPSSVPAVATTTTSETTMAACSSIGRWNA
jgi:hypothetical protein